MAQDQPFPEHRMRVVARFYRRVVYLAIIMVMSLFPAAQSQRGDTMYEPANRVGDGDHGAV